MARLRRGSAHAPAAEQPSALAMAAIRMAQHVLEARRERLALNEAERRRRLAVVKSERTEAA